MKDYIKKPFRITIRLSIDEFELIKERSSKANRPISTYIRETSLGRTLHERPQEDFIKALWNLDKMDINLNQIATRVNTYKYLDEKELKKIIEKLNTFIDELRNKYIGSG